MPAILFIIGALGSAGVWFINRRRHEAAVVAAKALAARHGFHVDTDTKGPPHQRFDLFNRGRAKKVSFHFWRPDPEDSVFQYEYIDGSGKHSTTYHHTCALISLPFAAPHTAIGPERFWGGLARAVGVRDIEVESPEFNDQYRVKSDDERFAVTLLDHDMLAWLLSSQSGRGAIEFELWGTWLLCVSKQLDVEEMFGYLDWSRQVRSHMPAVLPSLYPSAARR